MATPISLLGLDIDDHGQLLVKVSTVPSELWMTAFRSYWHQPKGSTSTAFKNWVKPDFRGDLLVFERMPVDEFETGYKGVVKDAAAFANEEEALHEEKLAQEAKARAEAVASHESDLESERAKARAIKFE